MVNFLYIFCKFAKCLETFSVNDGRTSFVVFGLGDSHGLEGRQRSQDGTTNPDGVFSFGGRDDLDLHGGRSQGGDFLLHSIGNTGVHGGTTGQDVVGVQVLSDVDVALHDGVVSGFVDTSGFHTDERRLEQSFRASESFVTNGDNLTIGQFIRFFQRGGRSGGGHFLFEVQSDIAQFFLDVSDDFSFSGGDERVPSVRQDLHQVVGQVSAGQVQSHDSVGEGITFEDGDVVGNTITRVQDNTGGSAGGVQGEDGLDSNVHGRQVESFKHDLSHLFSVSLGVQGSFSQQSGAFFGGNSQFVVVSVVPDLFHIIPVGNDTVFNGVFQGEDTSLRLGFITDIGVFLTHTDHNTLVSRSANGGGEDSSGSIITSETALAQTGTVVDNQVGSFSFFVRGHCWIFFFSYLVGTKIPM